MLGWMDDEALARTLTTGRATYWSRSRQQYWVKGETSGHRQWVKEVRLDCDGDTLLVKVDQEGPACHTGDADLLRRRRAARPPMAEPRPPYVRTGRRARRLASAGSRPWPAAGLAGLDAVERRQRLRGVPLRDGITANALPRRRSSRALAFVVLACLGRAAGDARTGPPRGGRPRRCWPRSACSWRPSSLSVDAPRTASRTRSPSAGAGRASTARPGRGSGSRRRRGARRRGVPPPCAWCRPGPRWAAGTTPPGRPRTAAATARRSLDLWRASTRAATRPCRD